MPVLDPEIVQHRLPLKPECHPIKQILRRMKPEVSLKIKEEVEKQFNDGLSSSTISSMGSKCCSRIKERWESSNVCRLQRFE